MLAVGRILVGNPDLIVLDEPSEGIQPSIVQLIRDVLLKQNEEYNKTILLVEQNIELVRLMAHWCFVMDSGKIVAEMSPEELAVPEIAKQYLAI